MLLLSLAVHRSGRLLRGELDHHLRVAANEVGLHDLRLPHDLDVLETLETPGNARLFVNTIGGDQLGGVVRRTEHAIAARLIDVTIADTQVTEQERTRLNMAALILVAGTAQAVSDWLNGGIGLSRTELLEEIVRLAAAALHTILPDL